MQSRRSKKHTFIMSIVSMILCLTMLVGTSLAWFTDTAFNNGNRIEVGTLDVKLLMHDGTYDEAGNANYKDISDGNGDIFSINSEGVGNENGLAWEPGKTELVFLKVKNDGKLALNYNILLDVTVKAAVPGVNAEEAFQYAVWPDMDATTYKNSYESKIADAVEGGVSAWSRIQHYAGEENVGAVLPGEFTAAPNGALVKDEEDCFALALHMDEEAGNEFQGCSVELDVKVTAKQMASEYDSFSNQYDALAEFAPEVPAKAELLVNGGAEEGYDGWIKADDTVFGNTVLTDDVVKHSGMYSFKMLPTKSRTTMNQTTIAVVGGEEYTISGWVYAPMVDEGETSAVGTIKISYKNESGTALPSNTEVQKITTCNTGDWIYVEKTVSAPVDAATMVASFRGAAKDSEAIYWDDMSVYGPDPSATGDLVLKTPIYPYYEGIGDNIFVNPGFEELDAEGNPVGWTLKAGKTKLTNEVDDTEEVNDTYAGDHSMIVTKGSGKPYVMQYVEVKPNTTYQLSFWTKFVENEAGSAYVKLEFYQGDKYAEGAVQDTDYFYMRDYCGHVERYGTSGNVYDYEDWFRYTYQFTTPGGCDHIEFFFRKHSTAGNVYFDNVELVQIEETSALDMRTEEIFHYDEWGNATVTATATYPEDSNNYVQFYLKDAQGNVLAKTEQPISLNGKVTSWHVPEGAASWEFDISLMEAYMEEYTVEAVMCDADGNPVASAITDKVTNTVTTDVYRSSMPTNMNVDENGIPDGTFKIYDDEGNVVNDSFVPVIAYHAYDGWDEYSKWGINTIQANNMTSPELALRRLDKLQELGIQALVQLYLRMNPAGSPTNVENTEAIVKAVKDHPAVLGYMIMDEPGDQTCDHEAMKNSYKIIRKIDTTHPVYTCEIDKFAWSNQYVDIMSTDPYPGTGDYNDDSYNVLTKPYNSTKEGVEAMESLSNKPMYSILQSYTLGGMTPSYDQMRTQIYLSLLAGAKGYGFFAMDQKADGASMKKHELMVAAEHFAAYEDEIVFDYFIRGYGETFMKDLAEEADGTIKASKNDRLDTTVHKKELVCDPGDVGYRYVIWKEADKEGNLTGNLYAVLVDGNNVAENVSIELNNGTESIGEYTATPIGIFDENGDPAASFDGEGTLTYELGKCQSVLLKIVPKN